MQCCITVQRYLHTWPSYPYAVLPQSVAMKVKSTQSYRMCPQTFGHRVYATECCDEILRPPDSHDPDCKAWLCEFTSGKWCFFNPIVRLSKDWVRPSDLGVMATSFHGVSLHRAWKKEICRWEVRHAVGENPAWLRYFHHHGPIWMR